MANTEITNYDEEDRLSTLPVHILGIILSLLPIKSAVATSVLSHRWQYVWTHLPSLTLTTYSPPISTKQATKFWTKFRHNITKLASPLSDGFILILHNKHYYHSKERPSFTDEWLRQICDSHVRKIQVKTHRNTMPRGVYSFVAPATCVFQMKWLVFLELGGATFAWNLPTETRATNLPNLRKLRIHIVSSQFILLGKLISSIPSLVDVVFYVKDDRAQFHTVVPASEECDYILLTSPNLGRLHAHVLCSSVSSNVFVNAPKLWSLRLNITFTTPKVCCVGQSTFCYLQKLALQGHEEHHYSFRTLQFPRLNYLEIGSLCSRTVELLLDILKNSPVLLTLVLKLGVNATQWSPPEHIPECLLTKVELIMLSDWSFQHSNSANFAVSFAKYLLSSAQVLGTLTIHAKFVSTVNVKECQHDVLQFFKEMFKRQTRLLECQIKFLGAKMNVSCKGTDLMEELS